MKALAKLRTWAWIPILGVALNALWPLVAALNPGVPEPFGVQVCTPSGVVTVFDGARQLPGPGGSAHRLMPHCAFCSLGSGHAALHSTGALVLQDERVAFEVAPARRSSFVPSLVSASLGSRAPPA